MITISIGDMTQRNMALLLQMPATIFLVLVAAGDARYGSSSTSSSSSSNAHHVLPPGETSLGDPYFARYGPGSGLASAGSVVTENVTAQLGITTYLHCRVNNLAGKMVSWQKRHGDIPHLLTFGLTTYSNDARIQVFHEQPNDWKLQIQYPTRDEDEGLYECMVSSNPPILKRTWLTVVAPRIEVLDEREAAVTEKFYKGGSTIELTCRVERVVGQRPEYIIWHHEDRMLNYDTERGGISVKTDLLKDGAVSRLYIARASKTDSGNYTCGMRNAQTSVTVHILNGENPAAMQTGTSSQRLQSPLPLISVLVLLAVVQKWLMADVAAADQRSASSA